MKFLGGIMMILKKMLNDMIEEEIQKIEQTGKKVRLKSVSSKKILYTVIFGTILLFLLALGQLFLALIDLVIYFILLYRTNNVSVIIKLAKKSPNTPIGNIIRGEMKA